jgi:hypothetical protein
LLSPSSYAIYTKKILHNYLKYFLCIYSIA